MIRVNDNVIVDSREEFEKYLHPFDKDRFDGAILPSNFNLETASFPLALKFCPSYDAHFVGSWVVLSLNKAKKEMTKMLKKEICERAKFLEIIEKTYWQINSYVL